MARYGRIITNDVYELSLRLLGLQGTRPPWHKGYSISCTIARVCLESRCQIVPSQNRHLPIWHFTVGRQPRSTHTINVSGGLWCCIADWCIFAYVWWIRTKKRMIHHNDAKRNIHSFVLNIHIHNSCFLTYICLWQWMWPRKTKLSNKSELLASYCLSSYSLYKPPRRKWRIKIVFICIVTACILEKLYHIHRNENDVSCYGNVYLLQKCKIWHLVRRL